MPVLRSGNYVLYGFTLIDHGALLDGDTAYENPSHDFTMEGLWGWKNYNTDQIVAYPTTVTFTGPTFLDTTTEGVGLAATAPPPGFRMRHGTGLGGGPQCTAHLVGCAGLGLLGTVDCIGLTGQCGATGYQNTDPLLTYLTALTFYELRLTATVGLTSGGISKTPPWSTPTTGLRVTGGYDIVMEWFTIPPVSECGDRQEPHLMLAPPDDPPPAPWVPFDPDDPDAAPVPVVTLVTPDHGALAGGTAITIDGSGFGDGCSVAIDGVPCTSLVVVSSSRLTCVTPAHAAGLEAVVVTNEDGAH